MPVISCCRCRHKGCRGLRKSEGSSASNARSRRILLGACCDCGREKQHMTRRTILKLPPTPSPSTNCRLRHHFFLPVDERQGQGKTRDELLLVIILAWRPRTHALRHLALRMCMLQCRNFLCIQDTSRMCIASVRHPSLQFPVIALSFLDPQNYRLDRQHVTMNTRKCLSGRQLINVHVQYM